MTDKAVKVGDVVAWDDVPEKALVRSPAQGYLARLSYHYRRDVSGWYVGGGVVGQIYWIHIPPLGNLWPRWHEWSAKPGATIIALGLTGNETADDLRALAEAFEREHPTRDA